MKIIHSSKLILEKNPGISFGLIEASNVRVESSSHFFTSELDLLEKEIQQKFINSAPSENDIISATRKMYRSAGWEPTKYRPSSEALVRRLIKGNGLYSINNVVDFANLVSAKFHIPLGLYDLAKICGDIIFDIGKEGEVYEGLSKPIIHAQGKLILRDDQGVFGNPTADSLRTSIRKDSSHILTIFFIGPAIPKIHITKMIETLTRYYETITQRKNIQSQIQSIS